MLKRLASGLATLTTDNRRGKTWQLVPSERPKQSDLLLAFLSHDLKLPIADIVAADSPEMADAAYSELTGRVLSELDGQVRHSRAQEEVQLCILRKLDPANRKAIFHRLLTVGILHTRATRWRSGAANHPPITMLVHGPKGQKAALAKPPQIAPMSLPALTRKHFIEGGKRVTELTGLTSSEAFALFLEEGHFDSRARSILHMVLRRHGALLAGSAHALRRSPDGTTAFDCHVALRSVTLLGILLHKLGRLTENYMSDPAFMLGQLLAVADTVHVGYPVLLGNSVLAMAQTKPTRALSVLCSR